MKTSSSPGPTSSQTSTAPTTKQDPISSKPIAFGGTKIVLAEYGLQDQSYELNLTAAKLARQAADELSTAGSPAFRCRLHGPNDKSHLSNRRCHLPGTGRELLRTGRRRFWRVAQISFCSKPARIRAISKPACWRSIASGKELGCVIPTMVSGTIEATGTMLAGQTADAFYTSVSHARLLIDRPELRDRSGVHDRSHPVHARTLHHPRLLLPQRGLTGSEEGQYLETPHNPRRPARAIRRPWLAEYRRRLLRHPAGSYPRYRSNGAGKKPRVRKQSNHRTYFSGIEVVEAEESNRPLIVGERTNVIGSRLFKNMIA